MLPSRSIEISDMISRQRPRLLPSGVVRTFGDAFRYPWRALLPAPRTASCPCAPPLPADVLNLVLCFTAWSLDRL